MTYLFITRCESYTVAKGSSGCFSRANELQNTNINQWAVTTDVCPFTWPNQNWLLFVIWLNVVVGLGGYRVVNKKKKKVKQQKLPTTPREETPCQNKKETSLLLTKYPVEVLEWICLEDSDFCRTNFLWKDVIKSFGFA